jgi:hypothetical protein
MQSLHLITITDGYLPLAGTGHNTIRQYKEKYTQLALGDNVVMFHTVDSDTNEIIAQTIEFLQVSAMAVGTLDMICTHHGPKNHRWRFHDEISSFQHEVKQFYPDLVATDDEGNETIQMQPDAQYCAIYF